MLNVRAGMAAAVALLAGVITALGVSGSSPRLSVSGAATSSGPLQTLAAQEQTLVAQGTSLANIAKVLKNAGGQKSLANAEADNAAAEADNAAVQADLVSTTTTTATTTTSTTDTTTTGTTTTGTTTTPGNPGDLYVNATAPTGGNGTITAPYRTIIQCAAAITAGRTCWIETGTYTDRNVCPPAGATVEAYPGQTPVMNGGGASADAFLCSGRSNVRISGMTITDYDPLSEVGADASGAITFGNGPGDEADHNTISNITSSGQDAGIFVYNTSGSPSPFTILDNQVSHVSTSQTGTPDEDDIWVAAGDYYTGGLVQGNVVSYAGKDGIRLECGTHTATITVQDNIATHNTADGIDVNNCYATQSVLVKNNFVGWTTDQSFIAKHSSNATFINNTSVQPTSGFTSCGGFNCLNGTNGFMILGEVPFNGTGGEGTADGGDWNLTVENNIFYGGDGIQIGAGDYAVIKANNGVINDDDWYGWQTYMAYVDEHVTGNGGYDYFSTLAAFTASTGYETNGESVNPNFTNASAGNYTSSLTGKGADPAQLTGVGPTGAWGLANTGT
jgi:hypothetical protein